MRIFYEKMEDNVTTRNYIVENYNNILLLVSDSGSGHRVRQLTVVKPLRSSGVSVVKESDRYYT